MAEIDDNLGDGEKIYEDRVETLVMAPVLIQGANMGPALLSKFAGHSGFSLIGKFWRLYLFGFAAATGGMYAGYCSSAAGNIVANQGFINQMATLRGASGAPELNATHVSLWGGSSYITQFIFQFISPIVSDKYGRKTSLYTQAVLMLIAIILECVAKNWKVFLAAKLFAGASNAFLGTAVMTYMSEIAIAPIRGAMLAVFSFSFAFGQFFNAIGLQILALTAPLKFRNAFYSEFAIFGVLVISIYILPETPVWLTINGKHEQAKKAMNYLVGRVEGFDLDHEHAVMKSEVEDSVAAATASGSTGWSALLQWRNMKRCLAATMPYSYQNFVGTPLVFGYTSYFFQQAGLQDAFTGTVIVNVVLLFGIACSFYVVERAGRRKTVLISGAFMAFVDLAIGGLGFVKINSAVGAALISLCAIWVFAYSVSLAPIGWIALVELSSPHLRAKTAGVAANFQCISNIVFNYTVPLMLSDQYAGWGTKIGLFFAGTAFLWWIPTYFLLPESKGRSYAEMDELYARGVSIRKFAETKTSAQDILEMEGKAPAV